MTAQIIFWEFPIQSKGTPNHPFDEFLTNFVWSYSRRSTFERCVRCYYYQYFGANRRTAKQDPDKEILHLLKGISTRNERAGYILHLVIGTYLKKCQEGDTWNNNHLVKWAYDMFNRDIQYSQSDPNGDATLTGRFPPVLLHEFYYHYQNALDQCMETKERLI